MTATEHKPLIAVAQVKIGAMPVQAVEGRDLYAGLGVRKDFTSWAKQQTERLRLVPDRDYLAEVFPLQGENPKGGRPETRYWFALDAAKHIAMMANTERGFAVREYFIDCERRAMGASPKMQREEPPALPTKPFDEWTLEEIRTHLSVANAYRHTFNNAAAGWLLVRNGFPRPPSRLMPSWWQPDFDLPERRGQSVTITVPFSEERH